MLFAKIENNQVVEYPLYIGDLKLVSKHTSLDVNNYFLPPGYVEVEQIPLPAITYDQNVSESNPEFDGIKWVQKFVVTPASAEEIAERTEHEKNRVRGQRNALLSACDWTQLVDSPVDPVLWQPYRQALRDVSAQDGFPWNVTWPVQPE